MESVLSAKKKEHKMSTGNIARVSVGNSKLTVKQVKSLNSEISLDSVCRVL